MKKIFMILMCIMTAFICNAQNSSTMNYVGSSKFTDNWSFGVYGGVSTNLHTWNKPQGGHVGLNISRTITPIWFLEGQVQIGFNDLMNLKGHETHVCNGTVVDNAESFAMLGMNLTNAFLGYNGKPRVFEVSLMAGPGYGHGFDATGGLMSAYFVDYKDAVLAKAQLKFAFNIGHKRAHSIVLSPSVVYNLSGTGQFCSHHSVFNADLGYVYHFKTSNGSHYAKKAKLYDQSEVDNLNGQINSLRDELSNVKSENDTLRNLLKTTNENVNTMHTEEVLNVIYPNINFKKASTVILNSDELDKLAEQIKSNGNKVDIFGYASVEGSEQFNQKLSERRAMMLKQELTKRGCKKYLGKAIGMGTTNKFSTDDLSKNRVAIVIR